MDQAVMLQVAELSGTWAPHPGRNPAGRYLGSAFCRPPALPFQVPEIVALLRSEGACRFFGHVVDGDHKTLEGWLANRASEGLPMQGTQAPMQGTQAPMPGTQAPMPGYTGRCKNTVKIKNEAMAATSVSTPMRGARAMRAMEAMKATRVPAMKAMMKAMKATTAIGSRARNFQDSHYGVKTTTGDEGHEGHERWRRALRQGQ